MILITSIFNIVLGILSLGYAIFFRYHQTSDLPMMGTTNDTPNSNEEGRRLFSTLYVFSSILFLILSVLIHFIIKEIRISIIFFNYTLLFTYLCLITELYQYLIQFKAKNSTKLIRKSKNIISLTFAVYTLLTVGTIILGTRPPKYSINDKRLTIYSLHGISIKTKDIQSISFLTNTDKFPKQIYHTNGYSFGSKHKGYFLLNNTKNIYLNVDMKSKYFIKITDNKGIDYYLNCPEKEDTYKLYCEISKQSK